ncbi:MAG: hypothetical protein HOD43_10005 [Candidatus Marinimicrobia bacterium]|jgi:hypothetical protein|nr:hypothetical protein [Candidatus Neomarinimicrobiota bacterium]MBT3631223.1 hypothetical protein [Candidatus Neomarinimicrobiota bacterium]MBT3824731.1 hypothetical protein [Candidatus Neomarinimicrobiota bacterium]MBT4131655.1 hypothetical protein [Candidatus Neomarinimicrobiota bacterium]MBT4296124.1 hypothetical protein [Candidatus Neomarinimicrobiota bacterium]
MKRLELMLGLGQISMVLGLTGFLINTYFLEHNSTLSFFTGLFLGLSLVMNLAYLILRKK